jgi:hypothetical protein
MDADARPGDPANFHVRGRLFWRQNRDEVPSNTGDFALTAGRIPSRRRTRPPSDGLALATPAARNRTGGLRLGECLHRLRKRIALLACVDRRVVLLHPLGEMAGDGDDLYSTQATAVPTLWTARAMSSATALGCDT